VRREEKRRGEKEEREGEEWRGEGKGRKNKKENESCHVYWTRKHKNTKIQIY
jgi:hypothetical protein